ncbi:MAG: UDP-glucose 4-epimerase GalE [Mesorhizobium sp.]|nr:UDP-glucose 4-epimerase GalE [Mesorhizobium sp.]
MAVLVTGGAGYIGSHAVLALLAAGEEVIVLDRLSTGFEWAVPTGARLVIGDIGDRELVRSVIEENGIDAVLHFAGSIAIAESIADPLGYYANNTCKSRALIEAAVAGGVRHFIFSSTAAVYGETAPEPVTEATPALPAAPYGTSKLMTEIMLRDAAAAHDFTYTVLRYFNVAGADPQGRIGQSTPGTSQLIKAVAEAALGLRRSITIFGSDYPTPDGTCVRDYIHVADLATVHVLALIRLRAGGGNLTANCGYGQGYSVRQVIDSAERVHGGEVRVEIGERRPGDQAMVIADASLAREAFGWTPQFDDLDAIMRHTLAWEKVMMGRRGGNPGP